MVEPIAYSLEQGKGRKKECCHAQMLGSASSESEVHSLKFHVDTGGWMYKNTIHNTDSEISSYLSQFTSELSG